MSAMKTSSPGPYKASGMSVKTTPETVTGETSKAGSKAKARYPHPPISVSQASSAAGKGGKRAYTPGGPDGS
jgi:hypothetical protein